MGMALAVPSWTSGVALSGLDHRELDQRYPSVISFAIITDPCNQKVLWYGILSSEGPVIIEARFTATSNACCR
jgi:hypothetical protein